MTLEELKLTWKLGTIWETRATDNDPWVLVDNGGLSEPDWDPAKQYRRSPFQVLRLTEKDGVPVARQYNDDFLNEREIQIGDDRCLIVEFNVEYRPEWTVVIKYRLLDVELI